MEPAPSTPVTIARWQRWVLPGGVVSRGEHRRSARDWAVDVVIFCFAGLIGAAALFDWQQFSTSWNWWLDGFAGVGCCIGLWWRRTRPVLVAAVVLLISSVSLASAGAALVVLFNIAIRGSWRVISVVVVASIGSSYTSSLLHDVPYGWFELFLSLIFGALILSWALFVRAQRDLVTALVAQSELAASEQAAELDRARDAERRRIAREMHDVLAHRISMLSLHAGALEYRGADITPQELHDATSIIRSSASSAMQELADVIGVLRADDADGGVEPPQPTLASIELLIEECRAAGMRIDADLAFDLAGVARPSAAVEVAAYRVVQEGMTNARRHAAGTKVSLAVAHLGDELIVSVRTPATKVDGDTSGSGAGLIGLTERVELAQGVLQHGREPSGEFVLSATLPWPR